MMSEAKIRILNKASELFDLSVKELSGNQRYRYLMPARFAMYKALRVRAFSYPRIGKLFGGKDHSTIIHGVKRAEYMMERDPEYKAKVEELINTRLSPEAISLDDLEVQLSELRKANGVPDPVEDQEDWLEDLIHD